jgi:hypothetical protein
LGAVDGVEVFALDVFDQGHLGLSDGVDVADEGGDGGQAGELGRPKAALAGDELELLADLADQDRLDQAGGFDGGGEVGEGRVIE